MIAPHEAFDDYEFAEVGEAPPPGPLKTRAVTVESVTPPRPALPSITSRSVNHTSSRTPPHSVEAEEYLLSCCFLDGAETMAACAAAGLTSRKFHTPINRVIFDQLEAIHSAGMPVDLQVLAEELKKSGKLSEIGGYPYLVELSQRTPTTAQAAYFIGELNDLHRRRMMIEQSSALLDRLHNGDTEGVASIVASLQSLGPITDFGSRFEWCPVTAAELDANPPEKPNELLHGMLHERGTMMMSGASKSMKTFTMVDAGLAVATGTTWLGVQCAKASVVYLNLELSDYSMTARVQAIARAKGIAPPDNFHVMNLRGQLVTIDTLEAKLGKLIEKTGARLVIIDPHYKISSASGVEENSNDAQGLLLYRLENAVCKSGAALMIAHHFSKGDKSQTKAIDRAAGGGALARWPDVAMTLTDHEEESCAVAEFSLRDFAPIAPFVVRWTYPVWSRAEGVNPALLKKAGRKEEYPASQLLEKLKPGMTKGEWRTASGWSEGTFKRRRVDLEGAGKVRMVSGLFYPNSPQSPELPK